MTLPEPIIQRFERDLGALLPSGVRFGVAVSGGPDSLALLLLAAAVRPGQVEAATVNHQLRLGSGLEAEDVAEVCSRLGVPHTVLTVEVPTTASVQAAAREARYDALADWARDQSLSAILTGHHADDQAETLLMRLARGSGLSGLRGVRRRRCIGEDSSVLLLRPVLGWRRDELGEIVREASLDPVEDPSNSDERFDRTRVRRWLAQTPSLDPARLSASATHLAEAEEAIEWAVMQEFSARARSSADALTIDPAGVPREIRRRLLEKAIRFFVAEPPRGDRLARALDTLDAGGTCTLAGLKLEGGAEWRLTRAHPRR